jgi:hypothetical protein
LAAGSDETDVYKFTLTSARSVQAQISGLTQGVNMQLLEDTGDGTFTNAVLFSSTSTGSSGSVSDELLPGTYFVRIIRTGGVSTPYTLTVTPGATIPLLSPDPGSTFATARELNLASPVTVSDMVSDFNDETDVYKFTLTAARSIQAQIGGLNEGINLHLYEDTGSGNFANAVLFNSTSTGSSGSLEEELLPGTYYLRVTPTGNGVSTPYTLTVTPGPTIPLLSPDPGNTFATARELNLASPVTVSDMVSDFNDETDVYKFTLTAARSIQAQISGLNEGVNMSLQQLNGTTPMTIVSTSTSSSSTLQRNLAAGTYYVVIGITGNGVSTPYSLGVSITGGSGAIQNVGEELGSGARSTFSNDSMTLLAESVSEPADRRMEARRGNRLQDVALRDVDLSESLLSAVFRSRQRMIALPKVERVVDFDATDVANERARHRLSGDCLVDSLFEEWPDFRAGGIARSSRYPSRL